MRTFALLVGLILAGALRAEGIEMPCTGSPEAAVLEVSKPGGSFVHVLCTKFGHVLAPTAGWFWTPPGTYNPRFFPAQMVRDNPKDTGNSVYFKSIAVSPLEGKAAQAKWAVLAEIFPKEAPPDKALEIIAENNTGGQHSIYIFPNAWGYSCSPTCLKENAFIMISQEKKLPQW